jgi:Domain of unknown function (DUF1905)
MDIEFSGTLWKWQGDAAWYFISLPEEYYDELKFIGQGSKRGFGSIWVEATIGGSIWKTSIFPDSKSKTYLLPIKKVVRKHENITDNDIVKVNLTLLNV